MIDIEIVDGKEIVRHPGSVAIVAVDAQGRLALVRQRREPAEKDLVELPAGTREEGEEPLETAQRELREECGLHGGRWRELAAFWTTPGFCDEHMTLFLAQGVEEGETDLDDDEDVEQVRWTRAEVEERVADLEDAKTIAGLLLYLRSEPGR